MTRSQCTQKIVSIFEDFVFPRRSKRGSWLHIKGEPLTGRDCIICTDAIGLMVCLWYTYLHWYSSSSDDRWVSRWFNAIEDPDIVELIGALKSMDEFILTSIEDDGKIPDLATFKGYAKRNGFTKYVFPLYQLFRLLSDQEQLVKVLHHCLLFLSHLSVKDDYGRSLDVIKQFLEIETYLSTLPIDGSLQPIFNDWFKDFRLPCDTLWPCANSSGSVADCRGRSIADKYRSFCSDMRLDYLQTHYGQPLPFNNGGKLERVSRFEAVPKSYKVRRGIAMEPATLMYYQNGVYGILDDYVIHHPYLRHRFTIRDQSPNRDRAWLGSLDGSLATIDLSMASDSVHWRSVREWTCNTQLYPALMLTRSTHCRLPDGTTVELQKACTMGSKLCFYLECFVFGAIVTHALKEAGIDPTHSMWRVYGDDIIVESDVFPDVVAALSWFGFTVNESKSFSGRGIHKFRESCGGHYLNGVDVTPAIISRWFTGLDSEAGDDAWPVHLVELVNDCYHLKPFRSLLISFLNKLPVERRVLFNDTGEGGIYSPTPTNHHLVSVPGLRGPGSSNVIYHGSAANIYHSRTDEEVRLFEYLRMAQTRDRLLYPEDAVRVDVDDLTRKLVWGTALYYDPNSES